LKWKRIKSTGKGCENMIKGMVIQWINISPQMIMFRVLMQPYIIVFWTVWLGLLLKDWVVVLKVVAYGWFLCNNHKFCKCWFLCNNHKFCNCWFLCGNTYLLQLFSFPLQQRIPPSNSKNIITWKTNHVHIFIRITQQCVYQLNFNAMAPCVL